MKKPNLLTHMSFQYFLYTVKEKKRLTSHGSSLQISLSGGFSLASHKPSATTSKVDCNLHITDLVCVPPPQVAEHFVQGPGKGQNN